MGVPEKIDSTGMSCSPDVLVVMGREGGGGNTKCFLLLVVVLGRGVGRLSSASVCKSGVVGDSNGSVAYRCCGIGDGAGACDVWRATK